MARAAGIGPARTKPPLYKGWVWGTILGLGMRNEAYKRPLARGRILERISKPTVVR